jgi:hypothetical protein
VAVDGIAPKQHCLITFAEEVAGVTGGMAAEVDGAHTGNRLGARMIEDHEAAGVAVGGQCSLRRSLNEPLHLGWRGGAGGVEPVLGVRLRGVDCGAREDSLAVRRYQSAGVVGVQMGEQDMVNVCRIGVCCGKIGREPTCLGSQRVTERLAEIAPRLADL